MKVLLIDNYDSYSYNLFQLIAKITKIQPIVIKNNEIDFNELLKIDFDCIVISPGPGTVENDKDFGLCSRVIKEIDCPILGVCLGHQGIYNVYGGKIRIADTLMHGRTSEIYHNGKNIFKDIPQGFLAVRYHSLICFGEVPQELQIIATTDDNIIMAIEHKTRPVYGVQFHPESICTEFGEKLLDNFIFKAKNYINNQNKSGIKNNSMTKYCINTIENNKKYEYKDRYDFFKKESYIIKTKQIHFKNDIQDIYKRVSSLDKYSVWLDSSMILEEYSRYSIIGIGSGLYSYLISYNVNNNKTQVKTSENTYEYDIDIYNFLNKKLENTIIENLDEIEFDFALGFMGYLGYELKNIGKVQIKHKSNYSDAKFIFIDQAIIIDYATNNTYLMALSKDDNDMNLIEDLERLVNCNKKDNHKSIHNSLDSNKLLLKLERNKDEYINDIIKCKEYIKHGESYEICLTNRLNGKFNIDSLEYYKVLRKNNPAPYSSYINFIDEKIVCSSMERFLKIDNKKNIEAKPIKGTIKRGKNIIEDEENQYILKNDEKYRSENLMIVDLLRNDLGKCCEIGSINVPKLMCVEQYSTLHQLVSTVRGKIKDNISVIDCIRECFPGGSMTGAPKIRTMEIIDKIENSPRGIYSGAIGYISLSNSVDLNIVIRTAVIKDGSVEIGVGGAITAMSDHQEEFDEILLKSKSLIGSMECFYNQKITVI